MTDLRLLTVPSRKTLRFTKLDIVSADIPTHLQGFEERMVHGFITS